MRDDSKIREGGHEENGENDWVALARSGDTEAFENLYRAHVGRVYGLCLRLCGRREAAEELTQEVFIRVWKKLASFRFESAFSSWLYRLTVNVVLAELRSAGRRGSTLVASENLSRLSENPRAGGAAGAVDLEKAIASLPPGARTVFVLHEIEGYGHEEIAELTGVAPGTSKAQLHWARKALRESLKR